MSSMDAPTLEFFLEDSFRTLDEVNDFKFALTVCEKYRESIETAMEDFDDETQSWRDYRNSLWDSIIPEQISDTITAFLHDGIINYGQLLDDGVGASEILNIYKAYRECRGVRGFPKNFKPLADGVVEMLEQAVRSECVEEVQKQLDFTKRKLEEANTKMKELEAQLASRDSESSTDIRPHPAFYSNSVVGLNAARAIALDDNTKWTISEMLSSDIRELNLGELTANKAILLYLNKTDSEYNTSYSLCNMSFSEAIALMNVNITKLTNRILDGAGK